MHFLSSCTLTSFHCSGFLKSFPRPLVYLTSQVLVFIEPIETHRVTAIKNTASHNETRKYLYIAYIE